MWPLYKEWLEAGNIAAPAESLLSMTSSARYQLLRSLVWDWMTPYALRLGHDSIENCTRYLRAYSGSMSFVQRTRLSIRLRAGATAIATF